MTGIIRERYEVEAVIRKGRQGEVLRAQDLIHSREVALKVRPLARETDPDALLREARILLSLRPHPNLPVLRDDFVVADRYYMVMDWVAGRNLQGVLEEDGNPGLSLERVMDYLTQAAEALEHLHDHDPPIVHQDVKPSNLVLTPRGDLVLVDLGSSANVAVGDGQRTTATARYAAPELAVAPPTPAADIYSLAATGYALLTGEPPRAGIRPALPGLADSEAKDLLRALRRGLAVDPNRRPASAKALVEAMRAGAEPILRKRARLARTRRRRAVALALGLGAIIAVTTALLTPRNVLRDDPDPHTALDRLTTLNLKAVGDRRPLHVHDRFTVSFTLKNTRTSPVTLAYTFIAARDPQEKHKDFGEENHGKPLPPDSR